MNLLDDTNQDDQIQIDENKDYFEELTAPGAKFDLSKYENDPLKAARAIAKGKWHADATLDHRNKSFDELRTDFTKLREEYNAGPSLRELVDQMKANKESQNDNTQNVNDDKSDTLDLTKIEQMVQTQLSAAKQRDREEANFNAVQAKLLEAFGPNYVQNLKQQVSQLGLTTDFVNDLARKHPQVLYKTLGLDGPRQGELFQAPPQNTSRSDPFAPAINKRTWTFYEKMRKAEPAKYFDPKTQDQMFKDATLLGDAFEDGNYSKRFS